MMTSTVTENDIFNVSRRPPTTDDDTEKLNFIYLDEYPELRRVFRIIGVYFNVPLALIGIAGNILSTIVLRRSGLHRSSNILLFSLAVADMFFLFGEVSTTGRVYSAGKYVGWSGTRIESFIQFLIWELHTFCYLFGNFCSMTFPVLITAERLVATLMPLKFSTVVTAKRIWFAVGLCAFIGCSSALFLRCSGEGFYYGFVPKYNLTIGIKLAIPKPESVRVSKRYLVLSLSFIKGILSVIFVTIGCIIIGLKIQLAGKKRKDMTLSTSKPRDTDNRTTLTLVLVCVVYIVANGIYSIAAIATFIPGGMPVRNIIDLFKATLMVINSSLNIVIYVVANKNLRHIYRSVLLCKTEKDKT